MQPTVRCPNFNHGRADPPVRACPMCGEIVNAKVPRHSCTQEAHAKKRREANVFCVDCGQRLIVAAR